jgi:hypothetical protein
MSIRKILALLAGIAAVVIVVASRVVGSYGTAGSPAAALVRSPLAPGEAARQIASLRDKLGYTPHAVSVGLDEKSTRAELQNRERPQVTDRWMIGHIMALRGLIDFIHVAGPDPVEVGVGGPSVPERAFDLGTIDFTLVPRIAQAAIARARLEEAATVTGMELEKRHVLLPVEQVGELRWTVHISGGHEAADIETDPAGNLVGVDLTRTLRAQALDLYQGGTNLLDMTREIDATIGGQGRVEDFTVRRDRIEFHLMDGGPDVPPGGYFCNINGVFRDPFGPTSNFPVAQGLPHDVAFGASEVDWAGLPRQVQAARAALGVPDATVMALTIHKHTGGFDAPALQWQFGFQQGEVLIDSAGTVLKAPRQGKAADLLDPVALGAWLEMLRGKVGAHAAIMQLDIRPDTAFVTLRDPRKPSVLSELSWDSGSTELMTWDTEKPGQWEGTAYGEDWLFELGAVDAPLLQTLPARTSAALKVLNLPGGKVTQIIVGRQKRMFEDNRELVVMVGVDGDDHQDGRVFFDPRGKIIRSDGP